MYHWPLVLTYHVPSAFQVHQTLGRKQLLYQTMKIQPIPLRTGRKWFYKVVDRCITKSPSILGQKGQCNCTART